MSILLIIIGAGLLISGIYGLFGNKDEEVAAHGEAPVADSLHTFPDNGLSENERKGQLFEDFVISHFVTSDYLLVEKVNDYTSRHHTTERSKYADLVFRKNATGEEFAVECKYRSGWTQSHGKLALAWVEQRKIDDYNQFSKERDIDVIIVFGVGGTPDKPEEVFALPLRLLQKPLPPYQDFLKNFKVADGNYEYNARQHNLQTIR